MNGVLLFCVYMTFIYVPWDFFSKPVAQAQEVWFGILLTGWAAKATEPIHWLIYCFGMLGLWHMKSWMHPWAGLYVAQVAAGMLVWNTIDARGQGLPGGLLMAVPFLLLAFMLWRSKTRFIVIN